MEEEFWIAGYYDDEDDYYPDEYTKEKLPAYITSCQLNKATILFHACKNQVNFEILHSSPLELFNHFGNNECEA